MNTPETNLSFEALNGSRTEHLLKLIRSLGFNFAAITKDEAIFLRNNPTGKKTGDETIAPSKDIVSIESDRLKAILHKVVTENPQANAGTLLKIIYPEIEVQKQLEQQERENL